MTSSDILFDLIERVSGPSSHDSILVSLIWCKKWESAKGLSHDKNLICPDLPLSGANE